MSIESCTEDMVVVKLPPEPEMRTELDSAMEMAGCEGNYDMLIDFSAADIVTSSSLSRLLKLRKLLVDRGRRLVLFGLAPSTRGVFTVTRLDSVFEFADDKAAVLNRA